MTKKMWKKVMADFGLEHWRGSEGRGWLSVLPCYTTAGKCVTIRAVPYVVVKSEHRSETKARLAARGYYLANCLMNLVPGYHHGEDEEVFSLTRPSEEWWARNQGVIWDVK